MKRNSKTSQHSSDFSKKIDTQIIQNPHEVDMREKKLVLVSLFLSIILGMVFLFLMSGLAYLFGYYTQISALFISIISLGIALSIHMIVRRKIRERNDSAGKLPD
jgi:O-antigen/teichoic acid export membrane protein